MQNNINSNSTASNFIASDASTAAAAGGIPSRKSSIKGILKNVHNNNNENRSGSVASNASVDLTTQMNTSPPLSPQAKAKADYHKRTGLHWDEMNILATYHPADKDYGFMKIDEPSTPYYNKNENPISDDESCDAIDASKLESQLNLNREKLPKYMQEKMNLSDDDDNNDNNEECDDSDAAHRNPEFEAHRKAHYNEFQMAQLLKSRMKDEEEEDEDEENK